MNNGTQSSSRRRRQPTNVFMAKKTHQKPSNPQALSAERRAKNVLQSTPIATPPPAAAFTPAAEPEDDPSTYTDYPLVTTKKALLADLRFHAMRLVSRNKLSPYNRRQFERPLRLHRRFERDKKVDLPKQSGTDDKEVDKEAIREAERQATKEANQAQIAPAEKGAVGKRKQNVKRKVEDVYIANTVEAQKRRKLRYDETRPWHLEDLEGKNTWVGAYEAPLSETYAMLVLAEDKFRMVPIEKWYRFAPTGRFEVKDADFIEKWMNKKSHAAMRLLQSRDDADHRRIVTQQRRTQGAGRVGMRGENKPRGDDDDHEGPEAVHDADELDFEDNDFQDDDEGCLLIGEDEEVKDMERKIKNEMLGANIFTDIKEEKDWDAEEARNKVKKEEKRRKERKLRKTLRKREKKYEYESESDSDSARPKSSSEDSAGSDADSDGELKLEDTDVKAESKVDGDKPPSGASSVGSNTPAGQHGRSSSRHHNGASLKRPGSPMLSDVSGSESSRKRVKQTKENAASRPMSPNIGDGSRPLSRTYQCNHLESHCANHMSHSEYTFAQLCRIGQRDRGSIRHRAYQEATRRQQRQLDTITDCQWTLWLACIESWCIGRTYAFIRRHPSGHSAHRNQYHCADPKVQITSH